MGNERSPEDRFEPQAAEFEGEPDEVFRGPAELEPGQLVIRDKSDPAQHEPAKKHWWQRL